MDLLQEFINTYGQVEGSDTPVSSQSALDQKVFTYYAPGRVNLIGEHIDYNGGKVFPCALSFGTYGLIRLRSDFTVRMKSLNMSKLVKIDLRDNHYDEKDGWGNYVKGVIKEFQDRQAALTGFDLLIYGEIPNGSGLSSSASLEVMIATMLNDVFKTGFDRVRLVQMCQHSENTFNGVNCGIMDQFAVGLGRQGKAILLDCNTLDYEYVPLDLKGVKIVIGNTKKRRGLADSKYNERRAECEEALKDLQTELPVKALCQLTPEEFEAHKHLIRRPVCRKRAEHAVYENARVLKAVQVLKEGNIAAFGKLMDQSHDSLRDLYEVTGTELDTMVEEARKIDGTLGSRMTGAGFGGCTVSLVRADAVDDFIRTVGQNYQKRTGLTPEFYVADAGQGAHRVDEPIELLVEELLAYGLDERLIEQADTVFVRNQLLEILGLSEPYPKTEGTLPCREAFRLERRQIAHEDETPYPILSRILDYMCDRGMIEGDDTVRRDLMDARIMGLFVARPSTVAEKFRTLRIEDPEKASGYFYHLSRASHYVMAERIRKNLYWTVPTQYGDLEITINLSKPEKDPRVIATMLKTQKASYPKCLLCPENVGYPGRLDHPARQNLRQIPMMLEGEQWYLQYSPYTYYQEHCILLKESHVPMKIDELTFRRLFQFIEMMPHYFMGSNAGLPVVGGSILTHEHYQGGHHVFPMEKAAVRQRYMAPGHEGLTVNVLNWPLSAIRLSGKDREELIRMASHVLTFWEAYSDEKVGIYAFTGDTPHNAVTPIARFNQNGEYELDLVLRNNLTTDQYPLGVFHPHEDLWHIKKENIGLIEVMGLAILPGRLQKELSVISRILTGTKQESLSQAEKDMIEKHQPWIKDMLSRVSVPMDQQSADQLLKKEVGKIFEKVLEDAGVYKNDPNGIEAFQRFMLACGFVRK